MEINSTKKKGGSKCAMKDCRHVARRPPGDKLSYFSFPKDSDRAVMWIRACNRDDILGKDPLKLHKNYRVCSVHFTDSMFLNDLRNRLYIHAVPVRIEPEQLQKVPDTVTEIMVHSPIITKCQNFEQIFIKEEPLEENTQESELYENVLQSVKKEEYISDDDNQSDKSCDNTVTINNNIHKLKNTNPNGFCCTICNKSFTRKTTLTRHMNIHKGIKQFQCATCSKSFLEKSYLKTHMKIHSGVKKLECTICNKLFTHNSNLSQHLKIHSQTRAYKCSTCNKSFILSSHLKDHMKIHSGIRNYKCEICNKRFTKSTSLTRHNKIHNKSI